MTDEHRKLQVIVALIGICAATLVLGSGALMAYWLYWDDKPPFRNDIVYTMDEQGRETTVFRAGQVMLVYRDLCFDRDLLVTFGRSLRRLEPPPQLNISINSTQGQVVAGCRNNANVIQIPMNTPPGHYQFEAVVRWSNNPLREDAVMLPAPKIEIIR